MKYIIQEPDLVVSTSLLLYFHTSVYGSVHSSICLPFNAWLSVSLSNNLCVCLSVRRPSDWLSHQQLSVCLYRSVSLPFCQSVRPLIRLSIHLSTCPSVLLSLCTFVWSVYIHLLSICVCLYCLSICPSNHLSICLWFLQFVCRLKHSFDC